MAWWRALSAGLVRFGRTPVVNAVAFAALVANVGLCVWLIPRLGIDGRRARVAGQLRARGAARRASRWRAAGSAPATCFRARATCAGLVRS